MKGLVSWFASNGVVANLLMVVILVGGTLSVPEIRKEVFPEFSTDLISVSVLYPGAAPEEVEQGNLHPDRGGRSKPSRSEADHVDGLRGHGHRERGTAGGDRHP